MNVFNKTYSVMLDLWTQLWLMPGNVYWIHLEVADELRNLRCGDQLHVKITAIYKVQNS